MKHTKRILSFALVLIMVFALCAPALADRSYEPYKYYMCVGDSIAAGCSLTKDGSETYFDQETDDYTTVYNPDYIYYGYDYTAVPTAYHSLVADALDAKLCSMLAADCALWNSDTSSRASITITTKHAFGAIPTLTMTATALHLQTSTQ